MFWQGPVAVAGGMLAAVLFIGVPLLVGRFLREQDEREQKALWPWLSEFDEEER